MTQNELIQYVKERIKSIGPGENKITGELLQDVLLTLIANTWSTAGGSGITTCSFSFGNGDLDNNFSVTLEHQLSTVLPGILVFNDKGEQLGESYYTATVVDANNVALTFYEGIGAGTYKVVFVRYIDDVAPPESNYIEYLEESFSLFTGDQYQEIPYGWSIFDNSGETYGADFGFEESNGALRVNLERGLDDSLHGKIIGIIIPKKLKAGETYSITVDTKTSYDPELDLDGVGICIGIYNQDSVYSWNYVETFLASFAWNTYVGELTPVEDGDLCIFYMSNQTHPPIDYFIDNLIIEKIS